jgi:hypothetical protein
VNWGRPSGAMTEFDAWVFIYADEDAWPGKRLLLLSGCDVLEICHPHDVQPRQHRLVTVRHLDYHGTSSPRNHPRDAQPTRQYQVTVAAGTGHENTKSLSSFFPDQPRSLHFPTPLTMPSLRVLGAGGREACAAWRPRLIREKGDLPIPAPIPTFGIGVGIGTRGHSGKQKPLEQNSSPVAKSSVWI